MTLPQRKSVVVAAGLAVVVVAAFVAACSPDPLDPSLGKLGVSLISSETTMVTAWEFPNNPLTDPTLVGVAAMFPEYNRRAGRPFTREDRIVGCFYRSQNATGAIVETEETLPRTRMIT